MAHSPKRGREAVAPIPSPGRYLVQIVAGGPYIAITELVHWRVKQAGTALGVAGVAAAGLHFLGFSPWSTEAHASVVDFAAVVTGIALCAFLDPPRPTADPGGTMRLAFVGEFVTLLFFGPVAMTMVATIQALGRAIAAPPRSHLARRVLLDVVTAGSATQAAGVAHVVLGGTGLPLAWPGQGLPIAGAVAAYCFITCAVADVIAPLATGIATTRAWPRHAFRGCPGHVIGACIAVALIELVQHQAWNLLPLAAVPLYFAWDAYRAHAERLGRQDRRLDVVGSPDHGICIVDDAGIVRHWNDALAGLLDCVSAAAVGRHIADTVPASTRAELAPAVQEALASRIARTLGEVSFRAPAGTRLLNITILPDAEGAMLVWLDVTAKVRAEQSLRESAERFALVSEGANDGVWDLDESSRTVFVSSRWAGIVGLPVSERRVTREEWFQRVHPDDLAGLRKAMDALSTGAAVRLEHEHRVRHEDGSYRQVLCHGVAARDQSGRLRRIGGSLSDITESAVAREKMRRSVSRDTLTGLMNRAAFVERLGQRLIELRSGAAPDSRLSIWISTASRS